MKYTRVADREFTDGEVTWPQPRDFRRSRAIDNALRGCQIFFY
jgi:hypothetical protein